MKRAAAFLTAAVMLFSVNGTAVPAFAAAEQQSADSEDGRITWTLDSGTGVLTVTGSGEMPDYASPADAPWHHERADITEIVVEAGVTAVGQNAFADCTKLTEAVLPDGLLRIGESAFSRSRKLCTVQLPDSVTEIQDFAFYSCALPDVTLPSHLMTVSAAAFENNHSLQAYRIAGNSRFRTEDGLLYSADFTELIAYPIGRTETAVQIPDTVTQIGGYAFCHSTFLQSIVLPDGLSDIGKAAFFHCTALEDIRFPDCAVTVGWNALASAPYLELIRDAEGFAVTNSGLLLDTAPLDGEVCLPPSVRFIGREAVKKLQCTSLTVPDGCTVLPSAFADMDSLAVLSIGTDCTVGAEAFEGCDALETVTIGTGTDIAEKAFRGCCGLIYMTAAEDCKIGSAAFDGCTALWSAVMGTGTAFEANAFRGCTALTDLQYDRQVCGGSYTDDPDGRYHMAESRLMLLDEGAVRAGTLGITHGLMTDEYRDILRPKEVYNNGYHIRSKRLEKDYPDTVQELTDADGNIYAAAGYEDSMQLIPYDADKPAQLIENPGYRFGAAAISEKNELFVYWCFQIAKGSNDDPDDNAAELAALAARTENNVISKYDLSGRLLGTCGFAVNDTYSLTPLDTYNANLVVKDGVAACLFCTGRIRTHKEGTDRSYHQCCTFIAADTETMQPISVNYQDGLTMSYHTFGVRMIPTEFGLAAIGQNDGFRGLSVCSWQIKDQTVTPGYLAVNGQYQMFRCSGTADEATGDANSMYLQIGGFAKSGSTYAAAGKSQRFFSSAYYAEQPERQTEYYDVFVSLSDQTLYGDRPDLAGEPRIDAKTGETADRHIIWLTNGDAHESFGAVKVLTLDDGSYCVMWERFADRIFDSVRYVILDTNGNLLRHETEIRNARLSSTSVPPVSKDGKLIWAVTDEAADAFVWYTVDLNAFADEETSVPTEIRSAAEAYGLFLSADSTEYGLCGITQQWAFDSRTNTLLITGHYALSDSDAGWKRYAAEAETLLIAEGITGLGKQTFSQCGQLRRVSLPDTLTEIGDDTFNECTNLTEIKLPEHLTKIGRCAFNQCAGLTAINLPDTLTEIGDDTFNECASLTEIKLPEHLTKIGRCAFNQCAGLTAINLPDTLTEIGDYAFNECTNLTEIDLPERLEVIGCNAFRGCNLRSVIVPASVQHTGDYAFLNETDCMDEIRLLNPAVLIGQNAFGWYGLGSLWQDTKLTVDGYSGSAAQKYTATLYPDVVFHAIKALPGDLNGDEKLSVSDAVLLSRLISEETALKLSENAIQNADFDKNGLIILTDLTGLLSKLTA